MCFRPTAVELERKCPKCGAAASATDDICAECGEKLPAAPAMPGAPGAPGAPKAPGAPAAPKVPGAPKAPGQ